MPANTQPDVMLSLPETQILPLQPKVLLDDARVGVGGLRNFLRKAVGTKGYRAEAQGAIAESEEVYLEGRNRWLEDCLDDDPERSLPKIELANTWDSSGFVERDGISTLLTSHFDVHDNKNEKVGWCVLKHPLYVRSKEGGSTKSFIGDIKIADRGKGYGPATYLAILKALPVGGGLRTEGKISPDAERMWDRLVSKGVARRMDNAPKTEYSRYETIF